MRKTENACSKENHRVCDNMHRVSIMIVIIQEYFSVICIYSSVMLV